MKMNNHFFSQKRTEIMITSLKEAVRERNQTIIARFIENLGDKNWSFITNI
jgi:hypothetical protein